MFAVPIIPVVIIVGFWNNTVIVILGYRRLWYLNQTSNFLCLNKSPYLTISNVRTISKFTLELGVHFQKKMILLAWGSESKWREAVVNDWPWSRIKIFIENRISWIWIMKTFILLTVDYRWIKYRDCWLMSTKRNTDRWWQTFSE